MDPFLLNLADPGWALLASRLTTILLIIGVALTALIAARAKRGALPGDLVELHRQVDLLQRQLREAAARGEPLEEITRALTLLRGRLPEGDLRR